MRGSATVSVSFYRVQICRQNRDPARVVIIVGDPRPLGNVRKCECAYVGEVFRRESLWRRRLDEMERFRRGSGYDRQTLLRGQAFSGCTERFDCRRNWRTGVSTAFMSN